MIVMMLKPENYAPLVGLAIEEDLHLEEGGSDITAALIAEEAHVTAELITRESMVLCGQAVFSAVFWAIEADVEINWQYVDGDWIAENGVLCTLSGPARGLLTAERIAMNFLQTLSGTATTTRQYLEAMGDSPAQLLDTRKTLPAWRLLQKYAVQCAGGKNHRMGLYDAYLIKENHIAACGGIQPAVEQAKVLNPDLPVEVEVENLLQLEEAITAGADWVMLDNFSIAGCVKAVEHAAGRVKLEVSGNIELATIQAWAATGVDAISVGALTKHVRAVDLSLLTKAE